MSAILLIAPVATHPQLQGNGARIFRLGRMLQRMGHQVHLLYYGLEGMTDEQRTAMQRCWDAFYFLQARGSPSTPTFGTHYHIDDWYDPLLGDMVRGLCRRWEFQACLVNYVWLSRVFDLLPQGVLRVLDTHDVFGDRHTASRAQGMEAGWFYTSVEEEARGIARADLVIAIQDEEEVYFKRIGAARTAVIGHLSQVAAIPPRTPAPGRSLCLGYLASANPYNVHAIESFIQALRADLALEGRWDLLIAGGVCEHLALQAKEPVHLLGRVEQPADLYRDVTVVVNPMLGGTGLKIKTVEAIAHGMPTVCTFAASRGLDAVPPWMACPSHQEMVAWLRRWREDPSLIAAAGAAAWRLYAGYAQRQEAAAASLFGSLTDSTGSHG